jgi:hypothetical protein
MGKKQNKNISWFWKIVQRIHALNKKDGKLGIMETFGINCQIQCSLNIFETKEEKEREEKPKEEKKVVTKMSIFFQ